MFNDWRHWLWIFIIFRYPFLGLSWKPISLQRYVCIPNLLCSIIQYRRSITAQGLELGSQLPVKPWNVQPNFVHRWKITFSTLTVFSVWWKFNLFRRILSILFFLLCTVISSSSISNFKWLNFSFCASRVSSSVRYYNINNNNNNHIHNLFKSKNEPAVVLQSYTLIFAFRKKWFRSKLLGELYSYSYTCPMANVNWCAMRDTMVILKPMADSN